MRLITSQITQITCFKLIFELIISIDATRQSDYHESLDNLAIKFNLFNNLDYGETNSLPPSYVELPRTIVKGVAAATDKLNKIYLAKPGSLGLVNPDMPEADSFHTPRDVGDGQQRYLAANQMGHSILANRDRIGGKSVTLRTTTIRPIYNQIPRPTT